MNDARAVGIGDVGVGEDAKGKVGRVRLAGEIREQRRVSLACISFIPMCGRKNTKSEREKEPHS